MEHLDVMHILEAALICSAEPLTSDDLLLLFDGEMEQAELNGLLSKLSEQWTDRGIELVQVSTGWRFQTKKSVLPYLERLRPEKPPQYSRAALEILAIIAYRQPVTRGDIEEIRGVTVSSQIIRQLEDRGWIEVIGHRETIGRPGLYATTQHFLDDLSLKTLGELPPIDGDEEVVGLVEEMQASLLKIEEGDHQLNNE